MYSNIERICRICLNDNSLEVNLFNVLDYSDIFYLLTEINISRNDLFTGRICNICLHKLNSYASFRAQCITSHNLLKDRFQSDPNNIVYNNTLPESNSDTINLLEHNSSDDTTFEEYSNISKIDENSTSNYNNISKKLEIPNCDNINLEKSGPVAEVETVSKKTRRTHQCTYSKCSKIFLNSKSLDSHMKTHTGIKPYLCSFCGRGFTTSGTLVIHMRTHTGEKPLLCSHCPKDFSARAGLVLHLRSHTGEKPYLCSVCGERFRSSSELSSHARGHTGQKPFTCSRCKKSFRTSYSRTIHMRIHTGERPAKCAICSKSFISNGQLYTHMKSHKKNKEHVCEECSKAFKTAKDLEIHKILHSDYAPFVCEMCNKGFNRANNLAKHMRLHEGLKPYSCEICSFAFPTSSQLKIHIRSHTGERPYVCYCGKAFASSSGIARHRRKQHDAVREKKTEKSDDTENRNIENSTKEVLWVYEIQDEEDILENVDLITQNANQLNKPVNEINIISNFEHLSRNEI